ncbi:MAG: hypothetical protein ACLPN5_04820 [Roseiarcus sp.]
MANFVDELRAHRRLDGRQRRGPRVAAALAANPAIAARTVGASLSKEKLDKLELFDARAGYGYGSQYMGRYDHPTPAHSLGVGN